jgi:hypothetical protein
MDQQKQQKQNEILSGCGLLEMEQNDRKHNPPSAAGNSNAANKQHTVCSSVNQP